MKLLGRVAGLLFALFLFAGPSLASAASEDMPVSILAAGPATFACGRPPVEGNMVLSFQALDSQAFVLHLVVEAGGCPVVGNSDTSVLRALPVPWSSLGLAPSSTTMHRDGASYVLENSHDGWLLRLTPASSTVDVLVQVLDGGDIVSEIEGHLLRLT